VLDSIPPQVWLVVLLATVGFGPASYVSRHVAHAVIKRDITQPPEDLSWRSNEQLYRCLAILAGLFAVGVFIFTPQAEEFARSDAFLPSLFGVVGGYALSTVAGGWRNRRIEPLLRGFSQIYDRDDQPLRYWASLSWNAIVGCALFAVSLGVMYDNATPRCDDTDDEEALIEALETCDALLVENAQDKERRADLLADRGRVHHRLGNDDRALADYSDALVLEPADSYALYNRGLIYFRTGDLRRAIDDFSASLTLRPDNDDAYLNRGRAYLDRGNFEEAIQDFTTLYERDLDHPYALANRGIAHAWLGNGDLAERDFAGERRRSRLACRSAGARGAGDAAARSCLGDRPSIASTRPRPQ
jgi:tetratricopeptide (TPR) repeat protein